MFPAMLKSNFRTASVALAAVLAWCCCSTAVAQTDPQAWLEQLDQFPHAKQVAHSDSEVLDHEVGLGAMKKIRGVWQFKDSERLSGRLTRYTWQIIDGFRSQEVMAQLTERVAEAPASELLFSCDSRACGQAAQWANRVFRQRVLYGREDQQHYRVYAIEGEPAYRLMVYSAARTADRQYLHVDLLQVAPAQP